MEIYGVDAFKRLYFCKSPIESSIDKKCPSDFIVPRFTDSFNKLYALHFAAMKELDWTTALNEKRFTVSDTRASSRVMNSWSKHKVLPEGVRRRSNWKKFSSIELLWIDAVYKMQEFGLSLREIATVRDWIMQWDKKNKNYPWFEYYVELAMMSDTDPYMVVLPKGIAELATAADIEAAKAASRRQPHMLLISLKALLTSGFGLSVPKPSPLRTVAAREYQVLQKIRDAVNKEVRTRIRGGEIAEIETTHVFSESKRTKITELLKDLEQMGSYGEMTVRLSDGKPQSIELRQTKKFRDAISQQAGAITR